MNIVCFIILIFIFYSLNGYLHEYIYVKLHIYQSNFLTMLQFLTMTSTFCFIHINKNLSLKYYNKQILFLLILCGIIQVISKCFVNIASFKLSYATEITIRSCKIIPTVIFNMIIHKRVPSRFIILSTLLMGIGTLVMACADINIKNTFSISGLVYGIVGLVLDSIVCNIESFLFDRMKINEIELIIYEYSAGYFILLTYELINKEYLVLLKNASNNSTIIIFIFLFCISGAFAVYMSLLCTKEYGIITTVMITSSRKLVGIIMSFLLFNNKKFSCIHAISLFFIAISSIIYSYVKYNKL